jgi:hypothetical protein
MSLTVSSARRCLFEITAAAPSFHTTAATISRTPRMTPQAPCGRKLIPATSRRTGPIQQMPGNMRTPAAASRIGIPPTTSRTNRFIGTSVRRHLPFTEYSTPVWEQPSIGDRSSVPTADNFLQHLGLQGVVSVSSCPPRFHRQGATPLGRAKGSGRAKGARKGVGARKGARKGVGSRFLGLTAGTPCAADLVDEKLIPSQIVWPSAAPNGHFRTADHA